MEEKKVFKYIKKLLPLILVVCILATFAVNFTFRKQRTYTASAVINYNYEGADQGLLPSGEGKFDVNEIKSSSIMSKVIDTLGLTGTYSVDNLTSRITITESPDEDKLAEKDAKIEEGIDFVYVPTTYIVAFTATNNEGEAFARTILDEILDTYFAVYGENYVNIDHISNKLDKIYEDNYDYIEMAEYIDTCIQDTVDILYSRDSASPYYRSTETGVSFGDLIEEFNYIKTVRMSDIFATIYDNQITKDKSVLLSKYKTRIDNNAISGAREVEMIADVEEVINEYVTKMRDSGNTNITADYILDQVYNRDTEADTERVDQTVTYDELIYGWRDHNVNNRLAAIDTAYCNYVLNTFSACTGACGETCATSGKTCSQIANKAYGELEKSVSEEINTTVEELTDLYNLAIKTNDEYNEYLGCNYIQVLSTAATSASVDVNTYTIIAFVFFMIICCGGSILVGRLGDIMTATFYTDPITKFRNRAYFDNFLKKRGKHKLDDGTVMVSVAIANQRDINTQFGRETGDEVLKLFAEELKAAFAKSGALFVYNGNSHFVITMEKSDAISAEDALQMFSVGIDNRENLENVEIVYKTGVAETFRDRITSARKLLVESIKNYKEHHSEAQK